MSLESERNAYRSSAVNFHTGNQNGNGADSGERMFGNAVPGGTLNIGGSIDRSLSGLSAPIAGNPSLTNMPSNNYYRENVESNFRSSELGNRGSFNEVSNNSTTSSYGYLTENLSAARNSSVAAVSDYERREAYPGYRSNPTSRERLDFSQNPSGYEPDNRMSTGGSNISSSFAVSGNTSSRSSDTIVVTHVRLSATRIFDFVFSRYLFLQLPVNCTWQDLRDKFCEVISFVVIWFKKP